MSAKDIPTVSGDQGPVRGDDSVSKTSIDKKKKKSILYSFLPCSGKKKAVPPATEQYVLPVFREGWNSIAMVSSSTSLRSSPDGKDHKGRRTRVPDRPNCSIQVWNIVKNAIGKDITKIPIPVNLCEPLSMLQRLTENFEYAHVLDRAADCKDTREQLAFVAAYGVSCYSSSASRTYKPFNPLLGETYECDRTADLGWRAISEQVSHHPPVAAQHCEGKGWTCWQQFTIKSKFRGTSMDVIPLGKVHCYFNKNKQHYTWNKATTTVHNLFVGRMWVDQYGETVVQNHTDGSRCVLTYVPYSSDAQRIVFGTVHDKAGKVYWLLRGTWDGHIDMAPVLGMKDSKNSEYKTGSYVRAWQRHELPPQSELMYHFTLLACQLNEPEVGVAPTDSRLRPDQRLLEDGLWEEANRVKQELEKSQRVRRCTTDGNNGNTGTYQPLWFTLQKLSATSPEEWVYNGKYWDSKKKKNWSKCLQIYLPVSNANSAV